MKSIPLERHLCFKLYALSRQITQAYRPLLDSLDLTYPQYLVLVVLWEEKTINVKDLGARLLLDSGTLTPLLKRLEQKGLLSRQRDPRDERSVTIGLTRAGSAMKEKVAEMPEVLKNCLALDMDQYHSLMNSLGGLLDNAIRSNTAETN